eukprot:2806267-Rhodomonas_salina.2
MPCLIVLGLDAWFITEFLADTVRTCVKPCLVAGSAPSLNGSPRRVTEDSESSLRVRVGVSRCRPRPGCRRGAQLSQAVTVGATIIQNKGSIQVRP